MKKRKKKLRLTRLEQIELLKAPVAIEIIQCFRAKGPLTVVQLGEAIGRKPKSLHYHIRRLVANQLVHSVATSRSGARDVSIFDVTATRFEGSNIQPDEKHRAATVEAAAALLRLAARDYARATQRHGSICEQGSTRNTAIDRMTARLTKKQLASVNGHLKAIKDVLIENTGSMSGTMVSITVAMMPIEDEFQKP